jgi:nitroreductase
VFTDFREKDLKMKAPITLSLNGYVQYPESEMVQRSAQFLKNMAARRTVRDFSNKPVDRVIIENCIKAAATAPSGANCQPWHFSVVSDQTVKKRIRQGAEKVEAQFYASESTQKWVKDLEHLGTTPSKPFLEKAPYLIVIFSQLCSYNEKSQKTAHYYVTESVGIATGMLISALHLSGLGTLTYTPATMRFLNSILNRPSHEKAFMILVTGYPEKDVTVPVITKKPLQDIITFFGSNRS